MPRPEFTATITLGNILTILSLIGTVFTFILTDHADIKHLTEWRQEAAEVIKTSENRVTKLEEWKNIGPRFTAADAVILKQQAITEATAAAYAADSKVQGDIQVLSRKIDETNVLLTQIRLILAENKIKVSGQ
jgi:hypothetical protein